jgi:hypothetical protein
MPLLASGSRRAAASGCEGREGAGQTVKEHNRRSIYAGPLTGRFSPGVTVLNSTEFHGEMPNADLAQSNPPPVHLVAKPSCPAWAIRTSWFTGDRLGIFTAHKPGTSSGVALGGWALSLVALHAPAECAGSIARLHNGSAASTPGTCPGATGRVAPASGQRSWYSCSASQPRTSRSGPKVSEKCLIVGRRLSSVLGKVDGGGVLAPVLGGIGLQPQPGRPDASGQVEEQSGGQLLAGLELVLP